MSTYLVDSEISRFNLSKSTGWFAVSAGTCEAVETAQGVSRLSGGAFDVTVGPLVNLWGFGPATVESKPPPQSAIDAALERVDYRLLQTDCDRPALRKERADVYVDLSAYAKGLGVDEVADHVCGGPTLTGRRRSPDADSCRARTRRFVDRRPTRDRPR